MTTTYTFDAFMGTRTCEVCRAEFDTHAPRARFCPTHSAANEKARRAAESRRAVARLDAEFSRPRPVVKCEPRIPAGGVLKLIDAKAMRDYGSAAGNVPGEMILAFTARFGGRPSTIKNYISRARRSGVIGLWLADELVAFCGRTLIGDGGEIA